MISKKEFICKYCRKKFKVKDSHSRIFCSNACCLKQNQKDKVWLRRKDYNGIGNYQKHKKKSCEICKSKINLIVHHKDRNRTNNKKDNLITLCSSCQAKEHKFYKHFKKAYLIMDRDKRGRLKKLSFNYVIRY